MQHNNGFLDFVNTAKADINECQVDDIYEMIQNDTLDGMLIDTREESEFQNGFLPTAIHISKGIIEKVIEQAVPNKNLKMYLYCGGGFRSAIAAKQLQDMGYKNVISVDGGYRAWIVKGYPTMLPQERFPEKFIELINTAKSRINECKAYELNEKINNKTLDGIIIDTREDSEYAQFHINGALHLSKGQIEVKIESFVPNKEQKLYLYCAGGARSAIAADNLQKMGYTNVVSISDGIQGWLSYNYPITQN